MGLDQHVYQTKNKPETKVDFEYDWEERKELFYWRKHPDLQGWMQKLYVAKGGTSEEFNGNTVVLTLKDLDALENDVRQHKLPTTTGFFFGQSYGDEIENDLDFIYKARRAIADGYTVFYTSSW